MKGAFPPSSRLMRFTLFAASDASILPTAVLPVKPIFRTASLCVISWPVPSSEKNVNQLKSDMYTETVGETNVFINVLRRPQALRNLVHTVWAAVAREVHVSFPQSVITEHTGRLAMWVYASHFTVHKSSTGAHDPYQPTSLPVSRIRIEGISKDRSFVLHAHILGGRLQAFCQHVIYSTACTLQFPLDRIPVSYPKPTAKP